MLTHKFIFEKSERPIWNCNLESQTVKHILTNCKLYEESRKKFNIKLESLNVKTKQDVNTIIEFLKEIEIYKLI